MSQFSGKQGTGAMRERKMQKRKEAELRQVNPGAVSATTLSRELGLPLATIYAEVDKHNGWTVDERVDHSTVVVLRGLYGGAA